MKQFWMISMIVRLRAAAQAPLTINDAVRLALEKQ